jgi:penicillin-binding protein activator
MRNPLRLFTLSIVFLLMLSGCTTRPTILRTEDNVQTDFSGRWNDTDARITAQSMLEDVLSRPWLKHFQSNKGRTPIVVVGEIRNMSSEHIDTNPFIYDIERELLNSGTVRFVVGDSIRDKIRQERADQQTPLSGAAFSKFGAEIGADFMLVGVLGSTVDAIQGKKAVAYKVTLELISIETGEKVWIGDKVIKKIIKQSKTSW